MSKRSFCFPIGLIMKERDPLIEPVLGLRRSSGNGKADLAEVVTRRRNAPWSMQKGEGYGGRLLAIYLIKQRSEAWEIKVAVAFRVQGMSDAEKEKEADQARPGSSFLQPQAHGTSYRRDRVTSRLAVNN